jgi:predicted PurR-regulated permease PerM
MAVALAVVDVAVFLPLVLALVLIGVWKPLVGRMERLGLGQYAY